MDIPPRLPVLMFASLALALAPLGWGQSDPPDQPEAEKLSRLRAAKTVRIEIKQRYALGESDFEPGEDPDSDQKQQRRETLAALRQVSLPLAEEARRVCDLLGLRVLTVGQADLTLRIDVTGEPVHALYDKLGGQYSGAVLGGSILLRDRGGELLTHDIHFEYEHPKRLFYQIDHGLHGSGPHARPERAPFGRTLPGLRIGLLELAALGWGAEPLGKALTAQNPGLRAAAACVFGERGGAELKAVVPRLAPLLEDAHEEVRAVAAWALGESGDPAAVPPLLAALDKPEPPSMRPTRAAEPGEEGGISEEEESAGEAGGLGADVFQHGFTQNPQAAPFVRAALHKLTDQDFASAAEWRRWWEKNHEEFAKRKN